MSEFPFVTSAPTLCDIQDPTEARYAQALCSVFGFNSVHNVGPVISAGRPVLLFGWHDFYCEALARFPGRCWIYWTRSWAQTEVDAAGSNLAHVLEHVKSGAARLFWADMGDELPPGALALPPVWPAGNHGTPRTENSGVVATAGSLVAAVAARAAGGRPHVARPLLKPSTSDLAVGLHERAELLQALGHGDAWTEDERAADLLIDLTAGAWSWAAFDALRRGVPVLASASLAIAAPLSHPTVQARTAIDDDCVAIPGTSTTVLAEMARRLLESAELRREVHAAECAALDVLREGNVEQARESLREAGFVP